MTVCACARFSYWYLVRTPRKALRKPKRTINTICDLLCREIEGCSVLAPNAAAEVRDCERMCMCRRVKPTLELDLESMPGRETRSILRVSRHRVREAPDSLIIKPDTLGARGRELCQVCHIAGDSVPEKAERKENKKTKEVDTRANTQQTLTWWRVPAAV